MRLSTIVREQVGKAGRNQIFFKIPKENFKFQSQTLKILSRFETYSALSLKISVQQLCGTRREKEKLIRKFIHKTLLGINQNGSSGGGEKLSHMKQVL